MSVEEDTELRNLVAQTLENKGILPKIRAELRASVFLALEENISTRETLLKNEELSAFIQIPVGILILNLVREFLEFFNLDFTLSVFDPETKYGKDYNGITREKMIRDLNIAESKKKGPLLYDVISKIVNDFKDESKNNFKSEKNVVTLNLNHCDLSLNGEAEAQSPLPHLNATFVKYKDDGSSTPPETAHSNGDNEPNESIEEELSSNKSSTASGHLSSNANIQKSQTGENTNVPEDNVDDSNSFKPLPENSTEFDLLKFTPVKEVKAREKVVAVETEKKEFEEKTKSSLSVLGDLPPLSGKTDSQKNKMNEIRAIIDQGLKLDDYNDEEDDDEDDDDDDDFNSSNSSKSSKGKDEGVRSGKSRVESSNRSQKLENLSEKSAETDIIEENLDDDDVSDLIHNHNSVENQLTIDETVSKLSDVADHLESL